MALHPVVSEVIERIEADSIGGAADIAKEVAEAVATASNQSEATETQPYVTELETQTSAVLSRLPSFAPPINALHHIHGRLEAALDGGVNDVKLLQDTVSQAVDNFLEAAEAALGSTAEHGGFCIPEGATVLTYSMSSTVWRLLIRAKELGTSFRVVVTESRPGNEGFETVRKMRVSNIPVSVSIDACVGELVPQTDLVVVGADAISGTGAALCKVGTKPTALVASFHSVPFYVAADSYKFDSTTLLGFPFRVDNLPADEVFFNQSELESVDLTGTLFDTVPREAISGVICEHGVISPDAYVGRLLSMPKSRFLSKQLAEWARRQ